MYWLHQQRWLHPVHYPVGRGWVDVGCPAAAAGPRFKVVLPTLPHQSPSIPSITLAVPVDRRRASTMSRPQITQPTIQYHDRIYLADTFGPRPYCYCYCYCYCYSSPEPGRKISSFDRASRPFGGGNLTAADESSITFPPNSSCLAMQPTIIIHADDDSGCIRRCEPRMCPLHAMFQLPVIALVGFFFEPSSLRAFEPSSLRAFEAPWKKRHGIKHG
ncbi:hypothetical protein K490DRAFT_57509 [Saccharata proteae CBS 121410]|uniref:Uncharacterized protein n=1 Tax=Saccharata proteae CBS 121410 TaxID=1314787 RepID=A0A9P4HRF5_9PEZI|nr:hypothetical protein K490DRAFT_57509 [Saccharata proteae CBS 121410]